MYRVFNLRMAALGRNASIGDTSMKLLLSKEGAIHGHEYHFRREYEAMEQGQAAGPEGAVEAE
jgi:hypothetical protein